MTSPFGDNPFQRSRADAQSLDWRVTDAQRDRVLDYLGQAYADGRITISEFEKRMEDALASRTRRELNQTLSGLATVPVTSSVHSAGLAQRRRTDATPAGSVTAGMVGLAPVAATGPLVPLIASAVTEKGTWAHRQIANQANAQIYMCIVLVLLGPVLHVTGVVVSLAWMAYLALTVIQAIKGFKGETWRNPITRVIPFQIIKEGEKPRKRIGR